MLSHAVLLNTYSAPFWSPKEVQVFVRTPYRFIFLFVQIFFLLLKEVLDAVRKIESCPLGQDCRPPYAFAYFAWKYPAVFHPSIRYISDRLSRNAGIFCSTWRIRSVSI